jgi:hypothetical protein
LILNDTNPIGRFWFFGQYWPYFYSQSGLTDCLIIGYTLAAATSPLLLWIMTMKPTLLDYLDAACGCVVLFGLLALGLWVL